ncbi:30S ribosomal protein S8 [Candidatus Nomurabacteria bacterium RIFCSPHIGHO2_01_FULL_39_220]|uniref:Small ribosomal subunit protein uS8 n=1 Tax=Candidatus Nomurabacteria bacterium RIFCSPLOWO2_02_FULL_40_67 TaxID=1801787 RepID=A0A1F6Y6W4_9BACT|nr:MAG: 30S ribosomal protein S8 [Candidatus Nomurabacteria bacterium RBG_16_40_11]OGI70495.1 MAG: 30S ribosomal protein S8 [Candidatus Nomurabacteria bacterium RIFCSPHIGHO2_01_FULL_39_220]OGI71896.1 MAG: 30S ribosomal protein S8 [Candidatus Nomurabacteria bacterium RIFCSPHIGHO2_02_41_18]OGI78886.1 MAG: 30S ribosomal protein S8 [Candidatus Nomurabacteria bacterium RIFCSPHIGHO2_02_FULL_41_150]OGI81793.1 MAG: 30S ribosomal protein S8 [Candidatus Nomurabacteria bacterium RIFCSPHIGHO2_12_FULL_40_64
MDPIANMLITMKNGGLAGKESVFLPYSKMKNAIAECLKKEGYVADVSKKISAKGGSASGGKNQRLALEIGLIYIDQKPKITEVERISKQSRRVYFGMKDIHSVRNGSGLLVLSTSKGILSGKVARQEQVGGEALFRLW